ncbi:MAG: hypothetical protein HZB91_06705 [Elusimicrobia bacterium]|nr:hypothetical protein [Elusimicrobiota bacterium]
MIGWKLPVPTLWHRLFGNRDIAGVRYRCLLPLAELRKRGFPVEPYRGSNRGRYKAVLFSKTYGPKDQELARDLRSRGRGVLLDICDNHFYNPEALPVYRRARRELLGMIQLTDRIICSTPVLAQTVAAEAGLEMPPAVVADPVDPSLRRASSAPSSADDAPRTGRPRLLWFGMHGAANAPCGMEDLLRISESLERLRRRWEFELVVASNDYWKFRRLLSGPGFPVSYVPWRMRTFPDILASAWAVLIPITPNPFTLCKSNNRLATALFASIPVVADGIPSYRELADFSCLDDWEGGLNAVFQQRPLVLAKAAKGREYLLGRYLPCHIADAWEKVLAPWV